MLRLIKLIGISLLMSITMSGYAVASDTNTQGTAQSSDESAQNKAAGDAFLSANAKKTGVVTLPSGLQYRIVEPGKAGGKKPGKDASVTVDYEGKLLNGQIFDSSYQRKQPITLSVSDVIPGWQEALQLMPEGATWMLYVPPNLAYGDQGAGGVIGPNATLVFKVHLISIQ